jgi:hypothetical protein
MEKIIEVPVERIVEREIPIAVEKIVEVPIEIRIERPVTREKVNLRANFLIAARLSKNRSLSKR